MIERYPDEYWVDPPPLPTAEQIEVFRKHFSSQIEAGKTVHFEYHNETVHYRSREPRKSRGWRKHVRRMKAANR